MQRNEAGQGSSLPPKRSVLKGTRPCEQGLRAHKLWPLKTYGGKPRHSFTGPLKSYGGKPRPISRHSEDRESGTGGGLQTLGLRK